MGAQAGLIPHPNFGQFFTCAAGSRQVRDEQPVDTPVITQPPDAPTAAFSMMLGLLETLRNLALSGLEPAPFLFALLPDGRSLAVAGAESAEDLWRLRASYGSIDLAFLVSARQAAGGLWLQVSEPTGRTGFSLDQFCRPAAAGRYQPLPPCWRPDPSRQPNRSSASSAYHSTSGLIPYWGLRNSSLLNQRICSCSPADSAGSPDLQRA